MEQRAFHPSSAEAAERCWSQAALIPCGSGSSSPQRAVALEQKKVLNYEVLHDFDAKLTAPTGESGCSRWSSSSSWRRKLLRRKLLRRRGGKLRANHRRVAAAAGPVSHSSSAGTTAVASRSGGSAGTTADAGRSGSAGTRAGTVAGSGSAGSGTVAGSSSAANTHDPATSEARVADVGRSRSRNRRSSVPLI